MATIYNKENAAFSRRVHDFAKAQVYPMIWPGARLEISHLDGTEADMEDKIDVEVLVYKPDLKRPIKFRVQERWRRIQFRRWKDVTITEWNNATNVPAEFYDGVMDYVLYGYFDESKQEFGEVVLINVPKLRSLIAIDAITYTTGTNEKEQLFKAFAFDNLSHTGAMDWYSTPSILPNNMPSEYWQRLYLKGKSV